MCIRDRNGGVEVTVNRVAPDGTLLWGTEGVQAPSDAGFVAAPKVVGAGDGSIVVAWTDDASTKVQKLDATGAALWDVQGVTLTPSVGSFFASDLIASDDGSVIVLMTNPTGGFGAPIHLVTQKLAGGDGALLWGANHVKVFDDSMGSLQFGNFPSCVSDDSGGAVYAWYTSSPSLQCRVQRVTANGSELYAHQGLEVSTNGARLRVAPSADFDPASQLVYVFWTEENSGQSQWGLYGQQFNATGDRLWSDDGLQVIALGSSQITDVTTLSTGSGAMVAWSESISYGNDPISGTFVASTGDLPWNPPIVDLKTAATATGDLEGCLGAGGFGAFVWADGDSGTADVLAQNLNPDGTLGPGLFADGFESGDTSAWSLTVPSK